MDHDYIDEHDLVDRYLLRRLPAAERARFEDHFVDCPRCLDRLELARDFQGSLRAGVADQARQALGLGLVAWLARPAARALLAAAAVVLVAVPILWLTVGGGPRPGGEPQVNIPTYALGPQRGDPERLPVSAADAWLALAVTVDDAAAFAGYRLTVRDAAGEEVWRQSAVEPDRRGSLTVTFPPGSLPPGEYRLGLEGLDPEGRATVLETHAFRLTE